VELRGYFGAARAGKSLISLHRMAENRRRSHPYGMNKN
jgi:hypothetical protein